MPGRDLLLTVLRPDQGARNDHNEPDETPVEAGKIWAGKADLSDVEAVAAGQKSSARLSQFTMRANDLSLAITSDYLLRHGATAREWKVTGVMEGAKGRRRTVLVTGIQRSDV